LVEFSVDLLVVLSVPVHLSQSVEQLKRAKEYTLDKEAEQSVAVPLLLVV